MKKILDKSLLIYMIMNLIYILVGSLLVLLRFYDIKYFSYGYIVLLGINILIILLLFIKKKYKKNKVDIFLLLIIIFAFISYLFAYKPHKALFGEWGRYEGLFEICYYMTTIFLTSYIKKEDRKILIYSILIFGLIECLYAYAQKLNLFNAHTMIHKGSRWATGFCTNPNFFGTLMLLCICYSIGLYIESKDRLKIGLFLVFTYLFSIGILLSKARSAMVGLLVVMILLLVYSIKNKHIKKYIVLLLLLIFSFSFIQSLNLTSVVKDFTRTKSEIVEISKGNVNDRYGSGRIYIWKETLKVVPRYIVHGIGIDSLANVLDGKPIIREGKIVDKAHNEYLQILVTMGIFSLISYLCMHFIILKNGIKNTFKTHEIYFLLPVIGYLVQAQFNISVIEVAPIFYIALGLLIDRGIE